FQKQNGSRKTPVSLSMMDQSIDDMYFGCNEAMEKKVMEEYFPKEMKNNAFKDGWNVAKSFAKTKYENRENRALTQDQVQAIYVYTQQPPNVYDPFNAAVRGDAAIYSKAFPYHALHFWLTSAIQILNPNKQCHITYRRTKTVFTGKENTEMRFGCFASSSKLNDLTSFGTVTCFHIETCYGEEEVLIPPYEKFKIKEIAKESYRDLKECKTIFVLESAGLVRKLNCKANEESRAQLG
uniref:NAD(P)(+)--arginine ADP-ribosyltransferase n=1 Tax=Neogobius melanostomus TaxID=47308 RepID=A0A8C6UGP2_9GOBI